MQMTTVEAITDAIAQLPPDEIERVRLWLADRAEPDWDRQIALDEQAGRLNNLIEKAKSEHLAGRTTNRTR